MSQEGKRKYKKDETTSEIGKKSKADRKKQRRLEDEEPRSSTEPQIT